MFDALELHKLSDAQTFKPFRIRMSDDTSYDMPHHNSAIVTRNYVALGTDLDAHRILEILARCEFIHITQIEDLQPAS